MSPLNLLKKYISKNEKNILTSLRSRHLKTISSSSGFFWTCLLRNFLERSETDLNKNGGNWLVKRCRI